MAWTTFENPGDDDDQKARVYGQWLSGTDLRPRLRRARLLSTVGADARADLDASRPDAVYGDRSRRFLLAVQRTSHDGNRIDVHLRSLR